MRSHRLETTLAPTITITMILRLLLLSKCLIYHGTFIQAFAFNANTPSSLRHSRLLAASASASASNLLTRTSGSRSGSRSKYSKYIHAPLYSININIKENNIDEQQQLQLQKSLQFELNEVDVWQGSRITLAYDPISERYIDSETMMVDDTSSSSRRKRNKPTIQHKITQSIKNAFIPEGVTKSYYNYIKWHILQRYMSAIVHVFGTQSLLMGLGMQNKHRNALGLSAVLNWVLKDALGKIVRMIWASRMGRKFDPDAKRWRYRSSLLFALGNGLEVMTYVYPQLFLVLATMANSLKQMSMLTSSATRNALYNSFRDGTKENIGDITAKGEAQIAIVDLFGIISGVALSSKLVM